MPEVLMTMTIEELYPIYLDCGCRVTTDSRKITGGEIFFALKGENFDGNDYALAALEKGAAWAVADRKGLPENGRLILVDDAFAALQELAVMHRTRLHGGRLPVIGLTGTNGKTTTKNLIRAVLAKKYRVSATEGNLNNDIGVPLSLLAMRPDTEIAVIEMGANHPDDIAKLVRVSRPDYGLITNVGRAHLLGFGSFEGVKAAKGELYKWLGSRRGSVIFINEDDAELKGMAAGIPCHFFGYGRNYQHAEILECTPEEPFLRIMLDGAVIRTQLVGAYNADNVLAAVAIGDYFGVSRKDAAEAIAEFAPDNIRSQMVRTGRNTLIVDAYNANPSSMKAALDNFAAMKAERRFALLGDMKELGAESAEEHRKVVFLLMGHGIDAMLVGPEFRDAAESCGAAFPCFDSSDELALHLREHPVSGALVLVKGSRSTAMEKVLEEL